MCKSREPLKALRRLGAEVEVRVSPYQARQSNIADIILYEKAKQHFSCHAQVRDSRRPWVGEEEASFCRALREEGVGLRRNVYFEGEERSLENHFRVLDTVRERNISLEGEE